MSLKRYCWIDALKVIGLFFILVHTDNSSFLLNQLKSFDVVLLMILSGILVSSLKN